MDQGHFEDDVKTFGASHPGSFGFSPAGAPDAPRLPQPSGRPGPGVVARPADAGSALSLHREAPALGLEALGLEAQGRERLTALTETLRWEEAGPGTLSFARDGGFRCLVGSGDVPVALPEDSVVLLSSSPLVTGAHGERSLPTDACVWFTIG